MVVKHNFVKHLPWSVKYKPKLNEFYDQEEAVERVKDFVRNFKRSKKKALILFGPSGCGKTSLVYAIAEQFSMEIIELNASDFRDKENINRIVGNALKQSSLFGKQKILLIDELEGIVGRKDYGGLNALNNLIKEANYPIIMTANFLESHKDMPWDPKFNSIRRNSLLVKMKKLSYKAIFKILKNIAEKEKIVVDDNFLLSFSTRYDGDARAAVNDFQVLASAGMLSKEFLNYLDYRNRESSIKNALTTIFKTQDLKTALNSFDSSNVDIDEQFLWIDENLPLEYTSPKDLASAYEVLSRADVLRGRIVKRQYWRFLNVISILLTAGISLSKETRTKGLVNYKVPSRKLKVWISKNRMLKKRSIAKKIALKTHTSLKESLKNIYFFKLMFRNEILSKRLVEELELEPEEEVWIKNH